MTEAVTVTVTVTVRDLAKRFGATTALEGMPWAARHGQVTPVLGPNGAGKTTTIECAEDLQRSDSRRGPRRVCHQRPRPDPLKRRPALLGGGANPVGMADRGQDSAGSVWWCSRAVTARAARATATAA